MSQRPLSVLGKRDFEYLPYYWFGRPLVIEHARLPFDPDTGRTKLFDSCADGMIFTIKTSGLTGTLELLAEEFSKNVSVKLVWLDIEASAPSFGSLIGLPREISIVARDPAALVGATSAGGRELLLDVQEEQHLKLLERSPYSGVVLSDTLATSHNIRRLGASKSIAVRLPRQEVQARVQWLAHERVDAIVTSNAAEVLRVLETR
jgi:hypothetical protein